MTALRRDTSGFTLIELLMVMSISLVLLGATLTIFERLQRGTVENDKRTDTAEIARNSLDTAARQLRNLAKRLNNDEVILSVQPFDFVFQTSDPSRTWVRYCLDTAVTGTPERGQLWTGQLAVADPSGSPSIAGMSGACPGTGWTKTQVVADHVTNRIGGVDRPIFSYTCLDGTSACLASTDDYDQIINVNAQLMVDTSPQKAPPELLVATGVYLRNQNQEPVAEFEATPVPTPARTVMLNGSGSTDYEGRTLTYFWFKGTVPATDSIRCDQPTPTTSAGVKTLWGATLIGEGVTLTHTFPASDGGAQTIGLVVCDPGDRFDETRSTVVIP